MELYTYNIPMDFIRLLPGFIIYLGAVTAENPVLVKGTLRGDVYFRLNVSSPNIMWMRTMKNSSEIIIIARNIPCDSVVNGSLGGSAYFNVCVSNENNERVKWKYMGNELETNLQSEKYEKYPNGSLILYNITYNHEGEYIMTLPVDGQDVTIIESYYLKVYGDLSVPFLRSNQTKFGNGTNVTLQCNAEHNHNVTSYTFYRDQTPICSEPNVICRGSSLYFTPITEKDSGSYICTIQNPMSKNTSNVLNLTVLSPVSAVTLTSNSSGDLWAGQDSVSLYCTAQGSAISFSWSMNGNPVSSDAPYNITKINYPPKSILTISPVSKNDIGPFTCTASNLEDTKASNEISLNINWYPEGNIQCTAQTTSQTVQLGCSWSGGNPAANVTMIHNDLNKTKLDLFYRKVPLSNIIEGSNLTCNGNHMGRTSSCVLLFFPISQQRLKDEVIAGIILGILVGLVIIGVTVYFVFRREQIKPKMLINDHNDSSSSSHIYENTLPMARTDMMPSSKQDPIYEQKQQPLYCNVLLGPNDCSMVFLLSLASVTAVNLTSDPSEVLWEGVNSVALHCIAQGSVDKFVWKLNGEDLPPDHRYNISEETSSPSSPVFSNLTINPVSRNDSGPFTCIAFSGTINETSNALNLSLAWTPDTENITCSAFFYDLSIQLSCSWMGGQPAANVTMTFNGTVESAPDNVMRDVHPDGEISQPTFLCHGNHNGVNSSCSLLFENPQSTTHNDSSITSAKQGEEAVLTVDLHYGPYANFTWFHPNKDPIITEGKYNVQSNGSMSSLHISEVTMNENGTFECIAKSIIGSTSFFFTLDVSQVTDSPQNGLSGGEIAGIVIGVLAGVILIGVIVYFIIKK
ncbi:carcinoembryonic antigen-related cell adhesion molecule 1-like [Hyla sarda]|uniref:carcinoembryonic antigen-related cell adhesion molecule 1-like n=1 Tax=Hyla sarda TaxID=327740 RepID=UPI0024C3084C|nr:carcinoembryonic antigen-related cell adhesion molecule 1-like [Hyla sarda]